MEFRHGIMEFWHGIPGVLLTHEKNFTAIIGYISTYKVLRCMVAQM